MVGLTSGSGSGTGYGYSYGTGTGDGTGGNGYGSGTGDYGDGDYDYGYGSGTGDYGDGDYDYGYGSGYGSGTGDYGDGDYDYDYDYDSGYGSGSGTGDEWSAAFLAQFPARDGATVAFWRSDSQGLPSNGGHSTEPARVGLMQRIAGPLQLCTKRALHGTTQPWQYAGERLWVAAYYGEVQRDGDKLGALEREFLAEVTPSPWSA